MLRKERRASWLIGLVLGAATGFMTLLGGAPFLFLSLAFLAVAFAAARSLALLSGAFTGVGAAWLILTARAQLACEAFDRAPNQGCTGYGVGPFLGVAAVILIGGLLLGASAIWRAGQVRRQAGT